MVNKLDRKRDKKIKKLNKRYEKFCKKYNIRESEQGKEASSIKIITSIFSRRWFSLFLAFAAVFCCCALIFYSTGGNTATTVMSLNYEESAKGLCPNGTRFNISDFRSDEVMKRAIRYAGIGDRFTANDLNAALSVLPFTGRSDGYYITNSYKITLEKPRTLTGITAEDLLSLVAKSYKEIFCEKYASNSAILHIDIADYDALEFSEIDAMFSLRISQINRFLDMRINQAGAFITDGDGVTFRMIKKSLDNLKLYNYASFNSHIKENGIVKNKYAREKTLLFNNVQLGYGYNTASSEYNIRTSAIDIYNSAMTAAALIPTYDGANEFYMSRTKVGVDYIALDAARFLENSKKAKLSIDANNDLLANIENGFSPENLRIAYKMVEEINDGLNEIVELTIETDSEYVTETTRDYLTFSMQSEPMISRMNSNISAAVAAVFSVLLFLSYYRKYRMFIRKVDVQ